jgi:DNA-binding beta-propeller fold protein YncE
MKFSVPKLMRSALPLSVALLLAACGGGGTAGPAGGGFTYTVSGTVIGLSGAGTVVLQNNLGDNVAVSKDGNFAFAKAITSGNAYSVTVLTQPTNQRCMVANASGNPTASVSNVLISCASQMGGAMQGVALNLAPTVTTLAGSAYGVDGTGPAATFSGPYGVASDGSNLYVADSGNNRIRKIVIATGKVSTLAGEGAAGAADGKAATATFNRPQGITIDATNANLYVADTLNNKIRKVVIADGSVSTVAGVAYTVGANTAVDGKGTVATFNWPQGIAIDATSTNLYVADTNNNKIRKIVIAGGVVSSVTGTAGATSTIGATDGVAATATFSSPSGITSDGTYLYVADSGNNKIRKILITSGDVSSVTGTVSTPALAGAAGGAATGATFNYPRGITIIGSSLYVADAFNDTVRAVSLSTIPTATVSTLAGTAFGTDGTGAAASFSNVHGITSDGTNLYVADAYNNKIRKIVIATGVVTTFAGTGAAGAVDGMGAAGPLDGMNAQATFNEPWGITTDGANLYVADRANNKIRKIVIATGDVSSFTGDVSLPAGAGAVDGTGATVTFWEPMGITCDGVNLYVTDTYNNKIRKIVIATGEVSSLAGAAYTLATDAAKDGQGATATFNYPYGITTDGTNLFVVDSGNDKIRKITASSGTLSSMTSANAVVSSLTGVPNTTGVAGAADSTGATATFDGPNGITTDGTNLYVVDQFNNKIRKIVIATGAVNSVTGKVNTVGVTGAVDGAGADATFDFPMAITSDGSSLYVTDNHTIRKIQ